MSFRERLGKNSQSRFFSKAGNPFEEDTEAYG